MTKEKRYKALLQLMFPISTTLPAESARPIMPSTAITAFTGVRTSSDAGFHPSSTRVGGIARIILHRVCITVMSVCVPQGRFVAMAEWQGRAGKVATQMPETHCVKSGSL